MLLQWCWLVRCWVTALADLVPTSPAAALLTHIMPAAGPCRPPAPASPRSLRRCTHTSPSTLVGDRGTEFGAIVRYWGRRRPAGLRECVYVYRVCMCFEGGRALPAWPHGSSRGRGRGLGRWQHPVQRGCSPAARTPARLTPHAAWAGDPWLLHSGISNSARSLTHMRCTHCAHRQVRPAGVCGDAGAHGRRQAVRGHLSGATHQVDREAGGGPGGGAGVAPGRMGSTCRMRLPMALKSD